MRMQLVTRIIKIVESRLIWKLMLLNRLDKDKYLKKPIGMVVSVDGFNARITVAAERSERKMPITFPDISGFVAVWMFPIAFTVWNVNSFPGSLTRFSPIVSFSSLSKVVSDIISSV
jgi:hypothetical protein